MQENTPTLLSRITSILKNPSTFSGRMRAYKNRNTRQLLLKQYALKYPHIDEGVRQTLERFHANGGFEFGDNQVLKLLNLYHTLKKTAPTSIIEYGTGSSTFVNASYAIENQISYQGIEESAKWAKTNRQLIPGDYAEYPDINLDQYDRVDNSINESFISTETTFRPDSYFDFIFIDGPSLEVDGINLPQNYNTDIDKHILIQKPRIICIDNRRSTAEYIQKSYGEHYDYYPSDNWFFEEKIIDPETYNYFSVFIRKD